MRLAAVDVHYGKEKAVAACVLFDGWKASHPREERVATLGDPAPYVPGRFFQRELPGIREVLGHLSTLPELVIVDGYVWLDRAGSPGLGAHLWQSLGKECAVVGVAKNPLAAAVQASIPVIRGRSAKPLYVSAAGMPVEEAANRVREMHGRARVPTMLRRVDQLARLAN